MNLDAAPARKNSGMAIAALVLSILGISILGLIFGFIALSKAKKEDLPKGMPIAAIVISILWFVFTVWVVSGGLGSADS